MTGASSWYDRTPVSILVDVGSYECCSDGVQRPIPLDATANRRPRHMRLPGAATDAQDPAFTPKFRGLIRQYSLAKAWLAPVGPSGS